MTTWHFAAKESVMRMRLLARRQFLRYLSSGLVIASLPPLVSCGGGSSSPDNPPASGGDILPGAGTAGADVTSAQRLAVIQDIEAEISRLIGIGTPLNPDIMLAYLQQQPVFHEVGYSVDSNVVWAVFTDGRKLMVMSNLDLSDSTPVVTMPQTNRRENSSTRSRSQSMQKPRLRHTEGEDPLVTANQFRLINMWPNIPFINSFHLTENWVDQDTLPRIARIAAGLGYNVLNPGTVVDIGPPRALLADVEGLKTVAGDGVFFLTGTAAHMVSSSGSVAAICTVTPARQGDTLSAEYEADLDNGSLIYAIAIDHPNPGPYTYLAITPKFIQQYNWSFPDNSLVFLNVTGGGITNWIDRLHFAGAGLVMGWDDSPQISTLLGVAQDFFELLFATNHLSTSLINLPSEPRLRSYGIEAIYSYLTDIGLIYGASGDDFVNRLELLPGLKNNLINQLRPTIEYIGVSEIGQEIQIQGEFGHDLPVVRIGTATDPIRNTDPNNNQPVAELSLVADEPLSADAEVMSIIDWQPTHIRVSLPAPSSRDFGMIQVWLGDLFSNVAHLTGWTVIFQITQTIGGSLLRSVTMEVSFRGFVSGYRLKPDQALNEQWPFLAISNLDQGKIGWSASGSLSRSESGTTVTVGWSGAGNYGLSVPAQSFVCAGVLWVNKRRLDCSLEMSVDNGLHITTTTTSPTGSGTSESDDTFTVKSPDTQIIPGFETSSPPAGAIPLYFDDNWNLLAGSFTFADNDESVLGNDTRETQIVWQAAVAKFPPENDRGGR